MKILVNNKDYGFFSAQPITVQVIDWHRDEDEPYEDVLWCNHDGAEEEEDAIHHAFNNGSNSEYTVSLLKCNKCEAYKRADADRWEDAPFEGVTR